jgi:hypothetical protein
MLEVLAGLVQGLDDIVRQLTQLEALRLRFVHEIHAQNIPHTHGATNTGVWLRNRYRTWPDSASVKHAGWLDDEGATTAAALAAGAVNPAQARVIAKAVTKIPAVDRAEAQQFMIEQAASLGPDQLVKVGERLFETLDPDAANGFEVLDLIGFRRLRGRRAAGSSRRSRGRGLAGPFEAVHAEVRP